MTEPRTERATRPVNTQLSYAQAGVQYDLIDPLKIAAQHAAASTAPHLATHGFAELAASRGESAYVVDVGPFHLASIVECLGSKVLVADEMQRLTGRSYYGAIAQDTIAMAVNDLVTVGATPLVVQAYWAAGGSEWFADETRARALVDGWRTACDRCGVAWGGGETPALAGVVEAGRIDLAAACTGIVRPKSRLSLARKLAERLPDGYLSEIAPGLGYGEALLAPTVLYAPVTEALAAAGVPVHYAANITGHGWRKLLRHPAALTYHIHTLPPVPPVLEFTTREAQHDPSQAYGTFNMGAGFALYVPAAVASRCIEVAAACGMPAWVAGRVEAGPKRLVIEPLEVVFEGDALGVR